MKLSIITLNFRKKELTIACMESLYKAYEKQFESGEFELIVVDNLSGDDSVPTLKEEIAKQKYKNYTLIANDKNAGFGAGNNTGAAKAKGTYMLFLNNDTIVKNGLTEMVSYMDEHNDVAILGGPLKNFDGTAQSSSGTFFTPLSVGLLLLGLERLEVPAKISRVDWVKGALLMIRKDVFEKIHGFDENIFMYIEDMELCYRANKAGYHTYFYPDVSILHKDQGSSNRTFAIVHIYKGILYFFKKHKPHWEYLVTRSLLQLKAGLLFLIGKLYNNKYLIQTYGQALSVSR